MKKNKHPCGPEEQERRVQIMRSFLVDSLHVSSKFHLSSWYIRRFLRARRFDIEKTKAMIKGYFDFKNRIEAKIKREKRPASN
jgi:hypothetical protein